MDSSVEVRAGHIVNLLDREKITVKDRDGNPLPISSNLSLQRFQEVGLFTY